MNSIPEVVEKYVFDVLIELIVDTQLTEGNKRSDHPGPIYWRKAISDKLQQQQ